MLFRKHECSFLVYYTLSKDKKAQRETGQPGADVKSLKASSGKQTRQK